MWRFRESGGAALAVSRESIFRSARSLAWRRARGVRPLRASLSESESEILCTGGSLLLIITAWLGSEGVTAERYCHGRLRSLSFMSVVACWMVQVVPHRAAPCVRAVEACDGRGLLVQAALQSPASDH